MRVTVTIAVPTKPRSMCCPNCGSAIPGAGSRIGPNPHSSATALDVVVKHETFGAYAIHFDEPDEIKFCENETNVRRAVRQRRDRGFYKDGFHDYLVDGREMRSSAQGNQGCRHIPADVAGGRQHHRPGEAEPGAISPHLSPTSSRSLRPQGEADAFYAELQSKMLDEDLRRIQRQAFGGILWSKQYFYYDVTEWLDGDPAQPKPPKARHKGRNAHGLTPAWRTSSPCRTNGSFPGSRPGTGPFT